MSRLAAPCLLALVALGCSGRPRDVAGVRRGDAGSDEAGAHTLPAPPPPPVEKVAPYPKPRVLAHATSRVLAVDSTNVYFSDQADDTLYAQSKNGGDPVRLARRAPVAGALAIDGEWLAWIASPGDAVLKLTLMGFGVTTLRERGIFSDVAADGGDVFATEVVAGGGVLTKIGADGKSTKLATFDAPPRAVLVDATHVYVALAGAIVRAPRAKAGPVETLATGTALDSPQLDAEYIYWVVAAEHGAHVMRAAKTGGAASVVVEDARAAPIEIAGDELLYFDRARPMLRAVTTATPKATSRVLAEDELFARPSAIVADADTAFVASEDGAILAVKRK